MRNNRFAYGSGCFTCAICTRLTRDTGDNGGCGLCPQCYEICGLDNTVNDNGYEGAEKAQYVAECETLLAQAVKAGGDAAKIKKTNTFIWG